MSVDIQSRARSRRPAVPLPTVDPTSVAAVIKVCFAIGVTLAGVVMAGPVMIGPSLVMIGVAFPIYMMLENIHRELRRDRNTLDTDGESGQD